KEINNQRAASIGGPIKKDKLFFFFDTEGLRYILGTSQQVVVPTPAFGAAVVANLPANSSFAGPALNNSAAFYSNMFSVWNAAPGINRAVPVDNSFDTSFNLGCGDLNVGGAFLAGLDQFGGNTTTDPAVGPNGEPAWNPAYGASNGGGGQPCSQQFRSNAGQLSHEYIIATKLDWNLTNNDKLNLRVRF